MQSRFLFTLDSGKFRYLPPFIGFAKKQGTGEVGSPIEAKGNLSSSGSASLDVLLGGGFKRGEFNLLETGNDVPDEVEALFLRTLLSNFVNTGHGVLYIPFVGEYQRTELSEMLPNLSDQTIERAIRRAR